MTWSNETEQAKCRQPTLAQASSTDLSEDDTRDGVTGKGKMVKILGILWTYVVSLVWSLHYEAWKEIWQVLVNEDDRPPPAPKHHEKCSSIVVTPLAADDDTQDDDNRDDGSYDDDRGVNAYTPPTTPYTATSSNQVVEVEPLVERFVCNMAIFHHPGKVGQEDENNDEDPAAYESYDNDRGINAYTLPTTPYTATTSNQVVEVEPLVRQRRVAWCNMAIAYHPSKVGQEDDNYDEDAAVTTVVEGSEFDNLENDPIVSIPDIPPLESDIRAAKTKRQRKALRTFYSNLNAWNRIIKARGLHIPIPQSHESLGRWYVPEL